MKKITLLFFLLLGLSQMNAQTVVIGSGTVLTNGTGADPVDGYYKSMKYQVVYTAAELATMLTPYDEISSLGFSVSEAPGAVTLSGYSIRMGHTSATNSAAHLTTATQTVKNAFAYSPTVTAEGSFDMIVFDSNFIWNGVENIVIEICTAGPNAFTSPYGGVRATTLADGSRVYRTDGAAGACATNTNTLVGNRPNIQFAYVEGTPPACAAPAALTAINITASSADLGWTEIGGATNWDIEYGISGFTPTGTPNVNDTGDNPYTLNGLTANTTYDFYVRTDCGADDSNVSSYTGPFTFVTACSFVSTFPFLESFEGITEGQPNCWSVEGTTTTATYHFSSFPTGYVGRGMRFDSYINSAGRTSELITPIIDASALSSLELRFYFKNPTGGNFEILVSSDGGTTYTSLETGLTGQVDWIQKTYDLTNYISSNLLVKFKGTSNYGAGDARIYLDEVEVREIPSCVEPTAVTATNITPTSADLGWTAGDSETAWEYALLPSPSSAPASGTAIATNSYAATLTPSTGYDFYVRADCTGGDLSPWVKFSFNSADIAPDCASTPFPADGAINVPVGDIVFTWEAPTTGPTPTSYNLYAGESATGDDFELILNSTSTTADISLNGFGIQLYWTIKPVNGTAEAVGCPIWSFTTEEAPGYCLAAPSGQYPFATYSPTNCDGTTPNVATTAGYAGEYTMVNVVSGQTYQFVSSVATDFVTISDAAGTTPLAYGTTPVTWTSDVDGEIRFYTHLNDQCETGTSFRARSILCGESLGINEATLKSFTYFPNPVTNTLNMKAQSTIQNVSIYNMLGQEVLRTSPNTLNSEVDMSSLQTGAYFVKVTINDATDTIRVIKQ